VRGLGSPRQHEGDGRAAVDLAGDADAAAAGDQVHGGVLLFCSAPRLDQGDVWVDDVAVYSRRIGCARTN
jgi:hypothetical protein